MTHDQFASTFVAWLRDDAESAIADHLGAVLEQTRRTRQRPWWSSLERWLPMQTTMRLAAAPRLAWLLVALALILAIAVAAIVVGTRAPVLEPFGIAANGIVIYGDGDISAIDPATGRPTALITGPTYDAQPLFSLDGSSFAFVRATAGALALHVAMADGTNVRPLAGPSNPKGVAWSPDGSRLAVVDGLDRLWIVPVGGAPGRQLALQMGAEDVQWLPDGQGLVFRGLPAGGGGLYGLYRVGADGSGLRAIGGPSASSELYQAPALSPDGRTIMFTSWGSAGGQLFVVNVDGGIPTHVDFAGPEPSDYFAAWSPDGAKIIFHRGEAQVGFHLAVGPATGGTSITISGEQLWGAAAAIAFSPDGSKVIARYDNGSTWIYDASGGTGQRQEFSTPSALASWQRVAP